MLCWGRGLAQLGAARPDKPVRLLRVSLTIPARLARTAHFAPLSMIIVVRVLLSFSAWLTGHTWQRLRQIAQQNPEWSGAVQRVSAAAFDGCADSTAKVYLRWLQKFSIVCDRLQVHFPDVTGAEVALFLAELAETGLSASSLSQASAAISWAALVAGRSDPCRDRHVTAIIASVRRRGDEVTKAAPGTKEHLLFLYHWAQQRKTFVADRTFIISLALINGCARFDDISDLRFRDLSILPDRVLLQQHRTKTDQCGEEGIIKPLPKARDARLCPIVSFQKWLQRKEVGTEPENALFPTARNKNSSTPYSVYYENLKEAQLLCALPKLTPHAWRVGWATYAAAAGLSVATIAAGGGWRQQTSADGYIRRSTGLRLNATAAALNF